MLKHGNLPRTSVYDILRLSVVVCAVTFLLGLASPASADERSIETTRLEMATVGFAVDTRQGFDWDPAVADWQRHAESTSVQFYRDHLLPRISSQFVIHQKNEPLYERAPTLDENGKPYADFMLLIPGFKVGPPFEYVSTNP